MYVRSKVFFLGEMGKDFCPHVVQPFLENLNRSECNNQTRNLSLVVHDFHRNDQISPSAMAFTLGTL